MSTRLYFLNFINMVEVAELQNWLVWLDKLFRQYSQLEKQFWIIVWTQIKKFFPDNFDVSHLSLDSILADIKFNWESWNRSVALRRIDKTKFDGKLTDLYQQLQTLNRYKIDWFFIEVQWFNLNDEKDDHHLVNIRFVKEDDLIIDWTSSEEAIKDYAWKLLEVLN